MDMLSPSSAGDLRFTTTLIRLRFVLLAAALINGVLAGLRWPQTYALSHMIIDYHGGFGKRGLAGAILGHIVAPPYHYVFLASIALAVTAVWIVTLLLLMRREAARRFDVLAAALLLFLSAGFASAVRDSGRGEDFGLMLALPCLFLGSTPVAVLARLVLLAAAILIHEANALIVAPFVLFDLWRAAAANQTAHGALRTWFQRCRASPLLPPVLLGVPLAALTFLMGHDMRDCDAFAVARFYQQRVADFQFLVVPVVTLCQNGAINFHTTLHELWQKPERVVVIFLTGLVVVPSTFFNLALVSRIARRRQVLIWALAASLAPVLLLLIAVDVVRFATLIQITSIVVLLSVARHDRRGTEDVFPPSSRNIAIVMILAMVQLGTSIPLNDGNEILKFPFTPLIVHAIEAGEGKTPFVAVPNY